MTQKTLPLQILYALIALIGALLFGTVHEKSLHTQLSDGDVIREEVHVAHVIDGDTIQLDDGRTVRYIGIDTPESGRGYTQTQECYAREATLRNRALVGGQDVTLVRDVSETDRYGRLLRYVYVGDVFVNEVLVEEGFAYVRRYAPDTAQAEHLAALQQKARAQGAGLWRTCTQEKY